MSNFSAAYAGHIRGRVYMKRPVGEHGPRWKFEVINTITGGRVAGDDGYLNVEWAYLNCAEVVESARNSWIYGFGRRGLVYP